MGLAGISNDPSKELSGVVLGIFGEKKCVCVCVKRHSAKELGNEDSNDPWQEQENEQACPKWKSKQTKKTQMQCR